MTCTALTPGEHATLRHATHIIRDAATGHHPANPHQIDAAHRTLTIHQPQLAGPVRDAVNRYLDPYTWQHTGELVDAIAHLARQLGLPPVDPPVGGWYQPTLFDQPPPG